MNENVKQHQQHWCILIPHCRKTKLKRKRGGEERMEGMRKGGWQAGRGNHAPIRHLDIRLIGSFTLLRSLKLQSNLLPLLLLACFFFILLGSQRRHSLPN